MGHCSRRCAGSGRWGRELPLLTTVLPTQSVTNRKALSHTHTSPLLPSAYYHSARKSHKVKWSSSTQKKKKLNKSWYKIFFRKKKIMKKFSVIFIQIFYKKHKHYFLKKYFLRRKILFTFKEASKILILLGILGYG